MVAFLRVMSYAVYTAMVRLFPCNITPRPPVLIPSKSETNVANHSKWGNTFSVHVPIALYSQMLSTKYRINILPNIHSCAFFW
jgi:hypothetical protein